jgi:hypothetical protein
VTCNDLQNSKKLRPVQQVSAASPPLRWRAAAASRPRQPSAGPPRPLGGDVRPPGESARGAQLPSWPLRSASFWGEQENPFIRVYTKSKNGYSFFAKNVSVFTVRVNQAFALRLSARTC